MKLTAKKLRSIIKEELSSLLNENYIQQYVVEPQAHNELKQILDSSDYRELSNLFKTWDEEIDTNNMVDDRDFERMEMYFPITSADKFFEYAEAYADMLETSQLRQGAKNIRNIIQKY